MNDDGTVARLPELERFAKEHNLLIGSIADLIAYRRRNERLVARAVEARLPTPFGRIQGGRIPVAGRRSSTPGPRHG